MIKIAKPFLITTILLLCVSCSSENDSLDTIVIPEPEGENPSGEDPAWVPAPPEDAVEIPGFPKSINSYYDGSHHYSAQFYFRSDGKLIQVTYNYPAYAPSFLSNTFSYNTEGKLIRLEGHNIYGFTWEDGRIVKATKLNPAWNGKSEILYIYNSLGQIIERSETFLDSTPASTAKDLYSYDNDGNIKSIESYDYDDEGDHFYLIYRTTFENYSDDKNLFWEVEIIPGQIAQASFPLRGTSEDMVWGGFTENEFRYKYDSEGRVIEKTFGLNKVVYEYY